MPDVLSERRTAARFSLILAVEIREVPDGAPLHARTSDVSRSGCYIDSLNPIPTGALVRVRLTRGREIFESLAKVMYVSPGLGMGLRFEEPLPNQLSILDRWLADTAIRR
jgi:PilZ domain-containing protein